MALPILPAGEIEPQVRALRKRIKSDIPELRLRTALLQFHDKYITGFWISKIHPGTFYFYLLFPRIHLRT